MKFSWAIDREDISCDFVEINSIDDKLFLIWSSASDLSVYGDLKQKDECDSSITLTVMIS